MIRHSRVKKWAEINKLFFEQDEMIPYANAYDENNFRKVKDVYEQTLKLIKQIFINGNTSKFDGDSNDLFNCAIDMIKEAASQEKETKSDKEKKYLIALKTAKEKRWTET